MHMLVLLVLFAWLGACRGDAVEEIARRLARLRAVASSAPRHKPCNASRLVVITEYPWGNAGNQLISFTHGLYMAQLTDATLVVPHYMSAAVLHPFNLTLIRSLYCFKEEWDYEDPKIAQSAQELGLSYTHVWPPPPKYRKKAFVYPAGSQVLEIESELCFFLYRFLQQLQRAPHPMLAATPTLEQATRDASALFVRVYCALWASPVPSISTAAALVLSQKLHSSLTYTAAHKRAMEGGCAKIMSHVTTPADFNPAELPMGLDIWARANRGFHPLCDMPAQLVLAACEMHYANATPSSSVGATCGGGSATAAATAINGTAPRGLFVAFDGRGDVQDYRAAGAVFSSDVDYTVAAAAATGPLTTATSVAFTSTHDPTKIDKKFVDMYLAMHSEFFVLNPRSTFSWEIYLIRTALALPSVPVMRTKDLYVLHPDEYRASNLTTTMWVGWLSAADAVKRLAI